ncbi:hypothetical protein [Bradyrhizobium iriomotense]|uniref:Uncharacterized protein n=1 Tax=Bradyrhizobium iriomotense TaxID=441950 RepID=A0ABQ6AWF7_9BRAD|nr:hypothetical protein [Bradyrhizobium iriomotense]GLR86527.1 hypothetical protein GCM10007857_32380 [Bradyrhizobium iriomotense]
MTNDDIDLKTVNPSELPEEARVRVRTPDAVYYPTLAEDMLVGARAIATYWKARSDPQALRATYFALERSHIPSFHFKNRLSIRKSTLLGYVWAQELKAMDDLDARLVRVHVALNAALPLLEQIQSRRNPEFKLKAALHEARKNIEELLVR